MSTGTPLASGTWTAVKMANDSTMISVITLWIVEAIHGEPCLGWVLPIVDFTLSDGISRPRANRYRDAALWKARAQANDPITSRPL